MSKPSPVAKQAAEVESLLDNATHAILSMPKDRQTYEHYRAEVERLYDAATAKLREELEQWQRIAKQRASDRNQAQDKMVEIRHQLANQQPSATTPDWNDFPPGGLHASSDFRKAAITPDVEKITQDYALHSARCLWLLWHGDAEVNERWVGDVADQLRGYFSRALAQAREPLVEVLEWIRARNYENAIRTLPEQIEAIQERVCTALTGTEEKTIDPSGSGGR